MARLRFTRRAEADLLGVAVYTLRTWGEAQASRYIRELEACCRRLAGNPSLGRSCDHVRHGVRRLEQGRHVVFYRAEVGGILVVRILHQRMLPEKHDMDEEDDQL
jgi:toxin ParE1/3/4